MYIRATANISPQKTFRHLPLLTELVDYYGNRLACIEPDYKTLIDAKLIRRMSRIIRMGVAAAMECLHEAGDTMPGAIVTGTAYGCLQDTDLFLTKMVEHNEELLTPTAFIQSTHNTIGAQIGLLLQCNNYNNTFVHRGFSFESALLDGLLLLKENEAATVLVGAIDEITNTSHTILSRMGLYKQSSASSLALFNAASKGTIAGEGAAFFLLATEPATTDYAKFDGLTTFYKPAGMQEIENNITLFLLEHLIVAGDIDLMIMGYNGDEKSDKIYHHLKTNIFNKTDAVNYKNLCGEYPTSTAFALWMAASIIKFKKVPAALAHKVLAEKNIKRILIYNNYQGVYHSLLLVSAC